jgi:REP element-mobilizing transposase RayT
MFWADDWRKLIQTVPQRCANRWTKCRYVLDRDRRVTVLGVLREVCLHHGWSLWAAHVRTNHVHAVVEADMRPEKVMHAFKAYASRSLNRLGIDATERKRWARHGSTRWLWTDEDVQESVRYVVSGQGEPMEVYLGDML